MNVKDRIYQIVADKSLSVDEKYAKIQELLHGKGNGSGSTSGGTGEGGGEGDDKVGSSSSHDSDSGNGEGGDMGGKQGQNGQGGESGEGDSDDEKNSNGGGESGEGDSADGDDGEGAGKSGKEGSDGQKGSGGGESGDEGDGPDSEDGQNGGGKSGKQQGKDGQGGESGEGDGESGEGDSKDQNGNGQDGSGQDGDSKDQNGNQGQQNGQNQQNNQGQQNQQSQQNGQGQGKMDPEEYLKDLDLGKKQQYKKAKGDGTDDPLINGLPPGETIDDDDDDEQDNQQGDFQMPQTFDDYKAGRYIGIAYAKEMFKGRGVKPTYGYLYDVPDVEEMRLIESMLMESDVDIRSILSGGGDDGAKADAIYKLLFPENSDLNAPEDLIMMRNGDVSLDDWGNDNHIISKELGDEIKKEIDEMPNSVDQDIKEIDPEWGATGSDGEVQERMKYIKKLLDPNYIQDKFKRDVAKKMIEKFGQRIEKNSEGVVDWKKSLEDFMYDVSHHREEGRIKKNLYTFSGIGARHKRRVYENIGKIVIYADTSGSAYSFCSTMIAEVSKMANDCEISEFDIHLFTDTVYAEHFGIDSETVQSEDFGFEDVKSGGTSLNNVYNHIIENYIDGYELIDDVSAIIIMTDVDGIQDSGRIDDSEYFKKNMDQILYLIFDPAETTQRALSKLMPKNSRYLAITPSMLRSADVDIDESVSTKYASSLLEAIARNIGDVKSTLNRENNDDEKRRSYMKRANVGAMRDLGRLDQLVPEIFKAFEENLPLFKSVKNVDYFEDTEDTFYIDDDLRVWVHGTFKNPDIVPQFLKLCESVKVYKLLGDIDIDNNKTLKNLPSGFPEIIEGNLYMYNLPFLETLDNLPKKMTGYYINIHDSRRHKNELMTQAENIGVTVTDEIRRSTIRSLYDKSNVSENMKMNEAVGRKLADVKKQLDKSEVDDEQKKEYLKKTNIRAMRDLGRMDQLVPEIFSAMNDILPEVSVVKSVDYFEDTEDTFYIDDDLRLWIHKDFDTKDEVDKLLALSNIVDVFMVIGRVCIVNNTTMKEFPAGFPKEIKGYFKMQNLFNLKNLNNAPLVIYGEEAPAIEPKSRWIRPVDLNKYKESLKDKQSNSIDVFDLLRKSTNESMNNKQEISNRIALGKKFMNEAFPEPLSPLFRQRIPQEPKYPEMPAEPNPDDYSDDDEGQRKLATAQKRYDAIKAKRERGMQRYEDEVKDYNERLRPLYRKNAAIFHDVISPILDANWGDIKDSDVKKISEFTKIHDDIKNNNKKFSGLKLFTDDKNEISLVYAKPMDAYYSKIVYFRDSDGSAIYDEDEINSRIKERDNIFRQANDLFVKKLNFKWDDLPQQKRSGETPNIEEVILNFLYWSFAKLNGSEKGGKQFDVNSVIYNEKGLSDEELLVDCMRTIFGGVKKKNDTAYYVTIGQNSKGGTVNLNADRQQGPGNCLNFIKLARKANNDDADFNPAEMLTDDVLRSLLLGLVVRAEYEGKKIYTADEVIDADRSQLISMVYEVLDFDIYKSSLTYMSYKYKDSEISKSDYLENPQSVLLLFPDVCRVEYVISADIKESILDNYEKRAQRQVNRAGMSSTIKDYDYDYRTGNRERKDIVGTFKKTDVDATALDQFEHYAEYFKDTKLDNINSIVRTSSVGRDVYKKYTEAIAKIKGYPDLIVSYIKNNPEAENEDVIMMIIEYYTAVEDNLEIIWKNNGNDSDEIKDAADEIITNAESIVKAYNTMTGNKDSRKTSAISKIITRANRRSNTQVASTQAEKSEYDSTNFKNMIDTVSKDYVNVKRIINTLDFANADEGAIEDFGSKDNMIRIITNHVDGALSFGRALLGANDGEKMEKMESLFKELSQILNDIVNFNDELDDADAVISKTLNDDLKKLARTISSEGKKYSSSASQGASVAV